MEVDDDQTQHSVRNKLPRFSTEASGELAGIPSNNGHGINNRLITDWTPSSRIVRVSRASGGKDRHSKVITSKGLRDRRIRLSVGTAIQFYDLQDRLGLDQPSKAVEWLLKAAADAIVDLPSINTAFPDEKMESNDRNEQGLGFGLDFEGQKQNQSPSLSKSACSSTSETSKNSPPLSLSRSEIRGKARERARERTAKEKEKERENDLVAAIHHHQNSFTQLLTGVSESGSPNPTRQWTTGTSSSSAEFFSPAQLIRPPSRATAGYNGQLHNGDSTFSHINPPFTISEDGGHQEPIHGQHFSFLPPESLIQTAAGTGDYINTLNFSISSPSAGGGISGYSRGTLQSNSPTFLLNNNIQRFSSSSSSTSSSSPMDSQSLPFFMVTAPPLENHNNHNRHQQQFPSGLDGRLQLYYGGDGGRNSDQKGKGKS